MSPSNEPAPNDVAAPRRFVTTRWSVVLAAGRRDSDDSAAALATLCQTYWYPLYAFVRRQGHQPAEAQDLVQEFFARVLEKDYLETADRQRGRFRTFLLTMLKRFLANEQKRAGARKRGGGQPILSLDFQSGEERLRLEPADPWTPEKLYERRWALTLLQQVLERLGQEYADKGKADLFGRLSVYLTATSTAPPYAAIAVEFQMTEGAVKVAAHRLRERYRNLLREEIANTVGSDEDVDDELHQLVSALSGQ